MWSPSCEFLLLFFFFRQYIVHFFVLNLGCPVLFFYIWVVFHKRFGYYFPDPDVFLSILFLNDFSLRSYLRVSDKVEHPYETGGKILVVWETAYSVLNRILKKKSV
jgi:hypothetical protein